MIKKLEQLKKSCLVLDVETSAQYPEGDVIDISTNFDDYVKFAKVKWFGAYSYLHDEHIEVTIPGNEDIIKNYIAQHDVIIGFNHDEFDIPIMYNNNLMPEDKYFLRVDCLVILGSSSYQRHDGLPFKDRGKLMGYKFKKNSLKYIAETMELKTQKGDIDYMIFMKNSWSEEEAVEIKKYLRSDVDATKEMFDKLWDFWMPFTKFISDKNVMNLSWIRASIASLTYQSACNTLGIEETYGDKPDVPKEEMGGRVIEPKYEEARNVWYVDFASLYPHIDVMFNIFSEVNTNMTNIATGAPAPWHGNNMFKVKGHYDIFEQHPLGLDVAEKLKERIRLKKEDPTNPMIYTLKIFLNSLYGAQRSPIFEQIHTPNAGWDICWLGQQIHKYTENRMKEFGFETIAGDTDSIFVILNKNGEGMVNYIKKGYHKKEFAEKDYIKHSLKIIVNEIKANVPFPAETFDIDIEKFIKYVMWPFSKQAVKGPDGKNLKNEKNRLVKELKGKKKNYLYLYEEGDELKLKIVGLPIIKDNATLLGQKILRDTLKGTIIEFEKAKFPKEFINNIISNELQKPDSIKLLGREFKVKPAASYKLESQIQAQISVGYFGGQSGAVFLIKNKVYGRAGKTAKYCTYEEAVENKLTIDDLDLTKLRNELEPFVKND